MEGRTWRGSPSSQIINKSSRVGREVGHTLRREVGRYPGGKTPWRGSPSAGARGLAVTRQDVRVHEWQGYSSGSKALHQAKVTNRAGSIGIWYKKCTKCGKMWCLVKFIFYFYFFSFDIGKDSVVYNGSSPIPRTPTLNLYSLCHSYSFLYSAGLFIFKELFWKAMLTGDHKYNCIILFFFNVEKKSECYFVTK
jgi:hypothetical protein